MLQAIGQLITTRRNFLIRATAVTAAGATVAIPIVTVESLRQRCEFHAKALQAACQEYYVGMDVQIMTNRLAPELANDPNELAPYWMVIAKNPTLTGANNG